MKKLSIPKNWNFKSANIAHGFNRHVREQLPWYDLATDAVAHIGRHYLPRGGLMYDVGASTGNIGRALQDVIVERGVSLIAIEESAAMVKLYKAPGKVEHADALTFEYQQFDFAVAFLCMMFFPVAQRKAWLNKMATLIRPGGALVIVDKVVTPAGYTGTVLRRMAMAWKMKSGTPEHEIVAKELSLAGYQRPLCPHLFDGRAQQFFYIGEFAGWIIERGE